MKKRVALVIVQLELVEDLQSSPVFEM